MRPLAFRLIGPAVGRRDRRRRRRRPGVRDRRGHVPRVGRRAAGHAPPRRPRAAPARGLRRVLGELREGFAFARSQTWLWATLLAAALALLCFWGPMEVLLPYLVKNELGGGASAYGLVVAGGGLGAIAGVGARWASAGCRRRVVLAMYLCWAFGSGLMALIGVVTASWQAALVYFVMSGCLAGGLIIWVTLLQTPRPARAAGPRDEPGLVRLGLARAAVVPARGARRGRDRRRGDARGRRRCSRSPPRSASWPCRACATSSAAALGWSSCRPRRRATRRPEPVQRSARSPRGEALGRGRAMPPASVGCGADRRDRHPAPRRLQRRRAADRAQPPGRDERVGQAARRRPAGRRRARGRRRRASAR